MFIVPSEWDTSVKSFGGWGRMRHKATGGGWKGLARAGWGAQGLAPYLEGPLGATTCPYQAHSHKYHSHTADQGEDCKLWGEGACFPLSWYPSPTQSKLVQGRKKGVDR